MSDLSILKNEFQRISLEEYKALEGGDVRRVNDLFGKRQELIQQFRLPLDRRRELIPFLTHKNIKVRLNAAFALLAVEPGRAWAVMGDIRNSGHAPFCLDAGFAFINVAKGIFVPD